MSSDRLKQQIDFILEIDKLKHVFRQTLLLNRSRKENDAEHSWHLATMAILLAEHADEQDLDIFRIVKMVLIHDLVEIDAGDTFAYDEKGYEDKEERELQAADRLFNMLPADQADEMYVLWREFEEMTKPEARFAAAIDRFQPLLHNYYTDGESWRKHGVARDKVLKRMEPIKETSQPLWEFTERIINDAVEKGYLKD